MKSMRKSTLIYFLLLCLAVVFCGGCGGGGVKKTVAVSFANSSASWQRNGEAIKSALQDEGFSVDLKFADTAADQTSHIKEMIENEPGCLVVGAVDSEGLTEVLAGAKEKNIPVIAYDRLVMKTDAVSYYASFDNEAVGDAMGEYIEAALGLKSGAGPFNIEFFAGDPADNNAHLFFNGAMKVLRPYLDNGQLVCISGEITFDAAATANWDPKNAEARMDKILAAYYADGGTLNAVLSPNDGVAGAVIASLDKSYGGSWPIITGQDADTPAIENIRAGKQTITILKNPADLTAKCVRMIKAVLEGTQPDINDVSTYNNGALTVPSYLCTPYIIDRDNLDMAR